MEDTSRRQSFYKRWEPFGSPAGTCPVCGGKLVYFYAYDADCCPDCNQWRTPNCRDPNCPFCSHRPETPMEALLLVEEERKDNQAREEKAEVTLRYQKRDQGQKRAKNRASGRDDRR